VALLTPTKNTRAEDFDLIEDLWEALGSVVIRMPPAEHDEALAVTSHLPHMAAAALAVAVPERYFRLTGSGLLDTTRLAGGDAELWVQILSHNRQHALTALEMYGKQLAALHTALRDGNQNELQSLLAKAKKNRDALGS